jgi:hypothetical protein
MTRLPPARKTILILPQRTPVSYRARTRTTKTDASTPAESISSQCALLDLPLELRLAIYRFALETDTVDKETKTPVLQIGERRALRRSARNIRINRYTLMNFTKEHLALFGTCIQSRSEIQTLMPSSSYHFTSADALGDFSVPP